MTDRYLCSLCDHFVSGIDLQPIQNYGIRDIDESKTLVGQCVCGGLVYEATDDEMIRHMEREIQARGLIA